MPLTWPEDPEVGDRANGRQWDGDAWAWPSSYGQIDGVPQVFYQPVGMDGGSIYHGKFWDDASEDLGQFFWEAWVCPLGGSGGSGQYWLSEGYGGNHALLVSPSNGNVYNGSGLTNFTSGYTPEDGEWVHSAVSWDGTNIRTYVNGVVTSVTAFAGPRVAQADQGGLYIAGSDHSNLHGKLAAVRGFESSDSSTDVATPYFTAGLADVLDVPFTPHRGLVGYGPSPAASGYTDEVRAQFAADYTRPGTTVVDLSDGYGGKLHHGVVGGPDTGFFTRRPSGYWVYDSTCPLRLDTVVVPSRAAITPPATPGSAKIFDSFSRANALLCWANTGLGSTEAGSLGAKVWSTSAAGHPWGVLDGRAVFQGTYYGAAWVANDSATMDVRVDRRVVSGLHHTGLCLRVVDVDHMLFVYTTGNLQGGTVFLKHYNGTFASETNIGSYTAPSTNWTTLRVTASGTTITLYCDNLAGGWTQIGQETGVTTNQAGTGAGLFSYWSPSSARRWDNFTVI